MIARIARPASAHGLQQTQNLPPQLSRHRLAASLGADELKALSSDLTAGFKWDLATLDQDTKGQFKPAAKGVVRSDFITPRIQVPLAGYRFGAGTGRVGFATVQARESAFYSLPADAATITD